MKKNLKSRKSQVLIISIFAFVLLFVFSFMVIEVGNLIYLKIHMQNIADAAAMEGGTWYARALNIVSLSNKVLFLTAAGGLVISILSLGTLGGGAKNAVDFIQKVQDVFAGTGTFENIRIVPALNAAAVIINGQKNENTLCIPVFNVEDFELKDVLPSFNLKRRKLSDFLDFNDNEANDKYYYRKKSTGEKVYVDEKDTRKNKVGWTIEKKTGKRLIKESPVSLPSELNEPLGKLKGIFENLDIPFDIVETGEHTILLVAIKKDVKQILGTNFFVKKNSSEKIVPSMLIATSMVKINGGKMDFWELDGASYVPKLQHVILPEMKAMNKDDEAMTGLQDFAKNTISDVSSETDINNVFSFLSGSMRFLTNNILLH
ncbi:MAG: Tad domain-containing protein [Candidatus Goldbacteria bacterium]|nr:Tad domain-containing protein [Candidatus Goldiibacteriota bacterium]HPD18202.1 Tad domain-containing protein [Candidatus Goldiibacteriota bacterium]